MASKSTALLAFILAFNLVLCNFASATNTPTTCSINGGYSTLSVCLGLLNGLPLGKQSCCPLIAGVTDLEAAVCLCLAIKGNLLGVILDVDAALTLLLNQCNHSYPSGYKCE